MQEPVESPWLTRSKLKNQHWENEEWIYTGAAGNKVHQRQDEKILDSVQIDPIRCFCLSSHIPPLPSLAGLA